MRKLVSLWGGIRSIYYKNASNISGVFIIFFHSCVEAHETSPIDVTKDIPSNHLQVSAPLDSQGLKEEKGVHSNAWALESMFRN